MLEIYKQAKSFKSFTERYSTCVTATVLSRISVGLEIRLKPV